MVERIVSLRAGPAIGVGGVYATAEGRDQAIHVAAQVPPFFDRQQWLVKYEDGPERAKIFVSDNSNQIPLAWSYSGPEPLPEAPVFASADQGRQLVWFIQPIDVGVPDAYTILAEFRFPGVAFYAGTNGTNEVVFKILPDDIPDKDKPYWVITGVD